MLRAKIMSDLGQFERFEVGHGEAGIRATDIGDDGARRQTIGLVHPWLRRNSGGYGWLVTHFVIGGEACGSRPGALGRAEQERGVSKTKGSEGGKQGGLALRAPLWRLSALLAKIG